MYHKYLTVLLKSVYLFQAVLSRDSWKKDYRRLKSGSNNSLLSNPLLIIHNITCLPIQTAALLRQRLGDMRLSSPGFKRYVIHVTVLDILAHFQHLIQQNCRIIPSRSVRQINTVKLEMVESSGGFGWVCVVLASW